MVEFQNPDTATFLDENKYVCDLDRAAIDCANSDKKKLLGEELQNHKALSTIELINNIHLVECYNKRIKLIDIIFLRFSFNDRIKHIKNFINNLCSRQHSFKSNKFDDKTLFFQFSKTDKIYSDLIKNLKISFEKSIDPVQDMLDDLQNSGSIYYYCIEGIDCFIYL